MDEQEVRPLDQMDEREVSQFFTELVSNLSAEEEYELRHEDYVMEMREFQATYPNPPSIQVRRILVRDGLWVLEGVNEYGGGHVFDVVAIIELRDGKMWRDTRYYAEPFEAPEWRERWVERMEP